MSDPAATSRPPEPDDDAAVLAADAGEALTEARAEARWVADNLREMLGALGLAGGDDEPTEDPER